MKPVYINDNMKKLLFTAATICTLALTACEWNIDFAPGKTISVSPTSISLGATEGSMETATVTCNMQWAIIVTPLPAWIALDVVDNQVIFTAKETNTTGTNRTFSVIFRANNGEMVQLAVTQLFSTD